MRSLFAIVTGAALLASCAGDSPASAHASRPVLHPRGRVVFLHGTFQNGNLSFGLLRHRLEEQGIACYAPTMKPSNGSHGLDLLAQQIKEGIDKEFGPNQRISIVGFSMGGLVARYYLQELGGAARCDALYAVATPHHGTSMALFEGGKGSNQMMPGSDFLKELDRTEDRLATMRVVSYHSPYDLVIFPTSSGTLGHGENISVPVLAHPLMTRAAPVVDDIERRILDHASKRTDVRPVSRPENRRRPEVPSDQ